jgi:hypothetical protein
MGGCHKRIEKACGTKAWEFMLSYWSLCRGQ